MLDNNELPYKHSTWPHLCCKQQCSTIFLFSLSIMRLLLNMNLLLEPLFNMGHLLMEACWIHAICDYSTAATADAFTASMKEKADSKPKTSMRSKH